MADYSDPILEQYIALVKAHCGQIKTFYQGEPFRIPDSDLPTMIISKRGTNVLPNTNTEDQHDVGISITVIVSTRQSLDTQNSSATVTAGIAKLYDIVEGRSASDFSLKATSLLDVLRSNSVPSPMLVTDLSTATRVDYSRTLKDRGSDQWSIEASVDFVARFIQTR